MADARKRSQKSIMKKMVDKITPASPLIGAGLNNLDNILSYLMPNPLRQMQHSLRNNNAANQDVPEHLRQQAPQNTLDLSKIIENNALPFKLDIPDRKLRRDDVEFQPFSDIDKVDEIKIQELEGVLDSLMAKGPTPWESIDEWEQNKIIENNAHEQMDAIIQHYDFESKGMDDLSKQLNSISLLDNLRTPSGLKK